MAQRFVNSFSPMTPIGAAMQNISLAMFGGKTPYEQETDEARIASYLATAQNARANAGRADAERRLTEDLLNRRTADREDQDIAFRSSMPLPRVRAIRAHLLEGAELPGDIAPDDVRRVGQFYFSHRGGLADKTYSPEGVEKGIRTGMETTAWQDALTNPSRVRAFGRAQNAREGRGEFRTSGGTGMVLNEFEGTADTSNPLAQAVIGLNRGRTNQANAAAGTSAARTRQLDHELRTGVRLGAPVLVDDPEVGPTYAPPSAAVGRPPAAKPKPEAAPKPATRKPLNRVQAEQVAATIANLAGSKADDIDPATRTRITSRATQLATDPDSEFHQDPVGAAEAAVAEIAPQGFEKVGTLGSRKLKPKAAGGGGAAQPATAGQQPQGGAAATERKTVGGKSYVKVNGQWFEE